MIKLIDPNIACLTPEQLYYPEGAVDMLVHHADEEYRFLHDNAIVWHRNTLFAAWYNCPEFEMHGQACIRGRRSMDGGMNWSQIEVVAEDAERRGIMYVPIAFCSTGTALYAFIANMVGLDLVTQCEAFLLDENTHRWQPQGMIADHFLPNCTPIRLDNGTYLMAGRVAENSRTRPKFPAVAISDEEHLTSPWTVVRLSAEEQPVHPETTVWANGATITAIVRGDADGGVRLFVSNDYGRTWNGPLANNVPAASSKLYAGILSTGQRYLIWNWPPNRETLVIGVSRPGEASLTAVWKIRQGASRGLGVGPEWSYPYAVEHDGMLYIIYTSEKAHSVMTKIPIGVLAVR